MILLFFHHDNMVFVSNSDLCEYVYMWVWLAARSSECWEKYKTEPVSQRNTYCVYSGSILLYYRAGYTASA